MTVIVLFYGSIVYLVFVRFELLPWNKLTRLVTLIVGMVLVIGFLTGYENLTPSTSQGVVTGRIVDIAPQVGGVVTAVPVKQNKVVEKGAVLFEIDPTLFAAQVNVLEANLGLARLRLEQFSVLVEIEAASRFQIEQTEAEIEQLEAQLRGARFNLENTVVRAPFRGRVPKLMLKPGVQVSPARTVMTFLDTEQLWIFGQIAQRGLSNVKIGDRATVNFPALPGRVYEAEVEDIPSAIAEGQFMASGLLDSVQQQRMVRVYPIFISLPEDFPPDLARVGLAASATIHTENSGPISIYAIVIQWIKTSVDTIL